jgi:secreted trypsin-like serine protease
MIQPPISRLSGRRIALLLATVAALLLVACPLASARAQPTRRRVHQASPDIVGGSDADPGSLPWLAQITIADGQYTEYCTGTVISSNLVLTAGHCVADETTGAFNDPSAYTVTTGTQDLSDAAGRQVSGVTQTFLDGYDPSTDDRDVGILELSTPTTAPAIQLATSSASL